MKSKRIGLFASLATATLLLFGCSSIEEAREIGEQNYALTVDYDKSIEELVKAGKYSRVYSEITSKNFPAAETGTARLTASLVRIEERTSISAVIAEQEKMGRRAATIKELLSFGESYPDIQTKMAVAGLGSYRDYYESKFDQLGAGAMSSEETRTLRHFYPCLAADLFGRSASLMSESMIPSYKPSAFYACFVAPAEADTATQ